MNTKKLIILASILLTVCLSLDAFRRARVATRRGAIAGGYGYGYRGAGYGYRGTDYGYGLGTGVVGAGLATAETAATVPFQVLS